MTQDSEEAVITRLNQEQQEQEEQLPPVSVMMVVMVVMAVVREEGTLQPPMKLGLTTSL